MIRYYCVHVSMRGRVSLRWSAPQRRPTDAAKIGQEKIAAGEASASFVVQADGQEREVLVSYTRPEAAKKLIEHYEDLLDAIDDSDKDQPDEP